MSLPHGQSEGLCLRYPENLGTQPSVSHEMAVSMLMRATHLSTTTPFHWTYLDRPSEGQLFLIFVPNQMPFPIDGLRYMDNEQVYSIPVGNNRGLEVSEVKFGFIPGHDSAASRVRRKFRMAKGGHPQLVLVHYSRGQSIPIVASLNQPVRPYPLRPHNEPAVYVAGERQGQKVYPDGRGGMGGPPRGGPIPSGPMGMGFGNPQAMLTQQTSTMDALDRRNRAERERSGGMAQRGQQPRITDEEDSADESEGLSVRALALARYRRNHEFMNAVFNQAAFGKNIEKPDIKPSYAIFKEEDLQSKIAQLESEIDALKAAAASRKDLREANELADVSMESAPDQSGGVLA